MLLQLHVFLSDVDDGQIDAAHETLIEFGIVDDGKLTQDPLSSVPADVERELSTRLFEDRPDNRERVDAAFRKLVDVCADSTVFKYRIEENAGEHMSAADPDEHVILYVTNTGVDEPRIRWRQELDPYDVSPRIADGRVFHATHGQVFALDTETGEQLWDHEFESVDRVPEVRDGLVVASGTWSVRGVDAESGELLWTVDFEDGDGDTMQESRAEIGEEYVYTGTRGGDVLEISKESGEWEVLTSFSERIEEIQLTGQGLLVKTGEETHAIEEDGTVRWTIDERIAFGPVRDGNLYRVSARVGTWTNDIVAIALDEGAKRWSIEAKPRGEISVVDDAVVVATKEGVIRIDRGDGEIRWRNDVSVNSAVPVGTGVIAGVDESSVLHLFNLDDGRRISTFSFGGTTQPPMPTDNGAVFVTGPELLCLEAFPDQ